MRFQHRRRLIIAMAVSGSALLVLATIGVFGLLRGPANGSELGRPTHAASESSLVPERALRPQPVLTTLDPERFARSVADALFTWDTRHSGGPSEWAQVLVDVADADEAAAVASDVRSFLPAPEMWQQLSVYGTRQWLEVESVTVPDAWTTVLAQATPGQLPRGASAFTVDGTRRREGTWGTDVLSTTRHVSFTVFLACAGQEPCTLLRLSQLDQPLE
ncbi:hypothetical protein [Agromyces neolithicus]|uniref:Secreted protein n=1 Tax=Agromyces neolithicus TaxID=269420 RepID=A0ABP4YHL3_9MICO